MLSQLRVIKYYPFITLEIILSKPAVKTHRFTTTIISKLSKCTTLFHVQLPATRRKRSPTGI